jgi:hypothetical protein
MSAAAEAWRGGPCVKNMLVSLTLTHAAARLAAQHSMVTQYMPVFPPDNLDMCMLLPTARFDNSCIHPHKQERLEAEFPEAISTYQTCCG